MGGYQGYICRGSHSEGDPLVGLTKEALKRRGKSLAQVAESEIYEEAAVKQARWSHKRWLGGVDEALKRRGKSLA